MDGVLTTSSPPDDAGASDPTRAEERLDRLVQALHGLT